MPTSACTQQQTLLLLVKKPQWSAFGIAKKESPTPEIDNLQLCISQSRLLSSSTVTIGLEAVKYIKEAIKDLLEMEHPHHINTGFLIR
ncbi:hypothetical protein Tco_1505367 [Tanacetum coccineum]